MCVSSFLVTREPPQVQGILCLHLFSENFSYPWCYAGFRCERPSILVTSGGFFTHLLHFVVEPCFRVFRRVSWIATPSCKPISFTFESLEAYFHSRGKRTVWNVFTMFNEIKLQPPWNHYGSKWWIWKVWHMLFWWREFFANFEARLVGFGKMRQMMPTNSKVYFYRCFNHVCSKRGNVQPARTAPGLHDVWRLAQHARSLRRSLLGSWSSVWIKDTNE